MKTTIDIDERKLADVMKLAGVRTREAAVDYALTCAEKTERLRKVFEKPLPDLMQDDMVSRSPRV
jgi:Arc/MetJ family transcription regulator